ncbi:MAG: hypothetical protein JWR85_3149 [Marmoricola sp.]|nr:hypothetical protein [Marmoricola sp.]
MANLGHLIVFMRQPAGIAGVMTSTLSMLLLYGLCFPAAVRTPTGAESVRTKRRLALAA